MFFTESLGTQATVGFHEMVVLYHNNSIPRLTAS